MKKTIDKHVGNEGIYMMVTKGKRDAQFNLPFTAAECHLTSDPRCSFIST